MLCAVHFLLKASKLDNSDVTLWYQLALTCASLGDLMLMRQSLEQVSCHYIFFYFPSLSDYFISTLTELLFLTVS